MYFTLPRELTGQIRCTARVIHAEEDEDQGGTTAVG